MKYSVPILLSLLVVDVAGTALRQGEPAKPKDINAKWEKLDDFLEVIFTMACKWKNGKDVGGAGAEALKKGEVDGADGYAAYVKDLQAGNVKGLQKSCGMIVSEGSKKCRTGCATGWNAITAKRQECDDKCNTVYANFDRSCNEKAEGLEKVYAQKSAKAAGQKQCYEGFCKEFPMVWMKAKESEMKTEVNGQCKKRCTDDMVKAGCQRAWALEADIVTAEVMSKCAEDSGLSKCMTGAQKTVSGDYDKCKSKTAGGCDKDYTDCTKKGNADKNFKDAKAFCDDRKKMCQGQADKKCLAQNKADLDAAESDCKADIKKELQGCQDKALDEKEAAAEKKCIAETGPKCEGECKLKCQVGKMNKCLLKLNTKDDPAKLFCTDFWHLLHASAETDPITGNPIALLSKASKMTPGF